MIVKKFIINNLDLKYYVGINQISIDLKKLIELNKLDKEEEALDLIFHLIEKIQSNYKYSTCQFFSDEYILNQDHIFAACYYVQKAFLNNTNISKKRNIEILLYLTSKRQIKNSIDAFGIKVTNLKSNNVSYCIVSLENNLKKINEEILQQLLAKEIEITLNYKSIEKYNKIKKFFGISNNQIRIVLNSYGINKFADNQIFNNLDHLFLALHDLICEKMALLSIENIKIN